MSPRLALAALTLSTLALAGCGSDIDTGYITKKVYEPQWVETQYTDVCTSRDPKTGSCTNSMRMPHLITHPAEWRLNLKEGNKTGYAYVAQETYDRYLIGQHYPDPR